MRACHCALCVFVCVCDCECVLRQGGGAGSRRLGSVWHGMACGRPHIAFLLRWRFARMKGDVTITTK